MNKFVAAISVSLIVCSLHAQTFDWVSPIDGAAARGMAMVCDPAGNVYVCGNVNGQADFDPGPGVALNDPNSGINGSIYLVKYGPAGNYIWHVSVGGSGTEIPKSLKLDHHGHLLVAGIFDSYFDWDPGVDTTALFSAGYSDGFVAQYDTSGHFHWVQPIGGGGDDEVHDVDIDEADNVYVTGFTSGSIDFDNGPGTATLVNNTNNWDSFFVKYGSDGTFRWVKGLQGPGTQNARSIACGDAGDIYVHGAFAGTMDADPSGGTTLLTSAGGGDVFLCKYDTAGTLIWAQSNGGPDNETAEVVINDHHGHLFITGTFQGSIDFATANGTQTVVGDPSSSYNYFAKLDTAGTTLWAHGVHGNNHFDGVSDIGIDSIGNVFITGTYYADPLDMDPSEGEYDLYPELANDIYLGKYTPEGQLTWAISIDAGEVFDTSNGLCTDLQGNVFVTGGFGYWGVFDPTQPGDSIFTPEGMNGFVAKYGTEISTHVPSIISTKGTLELYPSPANSLVNVRCKEMGAAQSMLVVDAGAHVVMRWDGRVPAQFDTARLATGEYMVILRTDTGTVSTKLLVQH